MSNTMRLLQAGQVPPSLWGYIQHIPCTVLFPHLKLHFNKQCCGEGMTCVVPRFPPSGNIDYLHTFQCFLVDTLASA